MLSAQSKPKPFRLQPPPPPLEKDVVKACLDLLLLRGYWPKRNHVAKLKTPDGRWIQMGEKGEPDWIVLHPTLPGFLMEVKRPGGALSADQEVKIRELKNGYRLSIAVVDSSRALACWLDARSSGLNA